MATLRFTANKQVRKLVEVISVEYGVSSSSTTEPDFSPTYPTLHQGDWLWTKTTYTNGEYTITKTYIAEDANVIDFELSSPTYRKNLRESIPNEIVVNISLQGGYTAGTVTITDGTNALNYITKKNNTTVTPTSTASVVNNDKLTLSIPKDVDYNVHVTLSSSTPVGQILKVISCIDETVYTVNFGALTSLAGITPVIGDYFVAATNFDNDNFLASCPYVYTANGWADIAVNASNASMLMDLVSTATSAGVTITDSSNLWVWCRNFVTENALVKNLFSQDITILPNGSIKSNEYTPATTVEVCAITDYSLYYTGLSPSLDTSKFKATITDYGIYNFYCYDTSGDSYWKVYKNSSSTPMDTISYGDMYSDYGISVDYDRPTQAPAVGDNITVTFDEETVGVQGFYIDNEGHMKGTQAEFTDIFINGNSTFKGSVDCGVIKTEKDTSQYLSYTVSDTGASQAYTLVKKLTDPVPSGYGLTVGQLYKCAITGVSEISYFRILTEASSRDSHVTARIGFYDSSYQPVDLASLTDFTLYKKYQNTVTTTGLSSSSIASSYVNSSTGYSRYDSYYNPNGFTLTAYRGGNKLIVNVPSQSSPTGLASGTVYSDSNGFLKVAP